MAYGSWKSSSWKNVWSNGYYAVDVLWSYRQDIEANKTQIREERLRVRSLTAYHSFRYTASQCGLGDFAGNRYEEIRDVNVNAGSSTEIDLTDRSAECSHNSDGSWPNGKYRGWYKFNAVLTGNHAPNTNWQSFSVDGSIPKIPRATSPTLDKPSVDVGQVVKITTKAASSSFTHRLRYSFGANEVEIATDVKESFDWTIPVSFATDLPNDESGLCTIYCDTYSGNSLIGTKSINLTILVPEEYVPTISSVSIVEATPGLDSVFGIFVQNKSKFMIETTAEGSNGSTITNCNVGVDGSTYDGVQVTTGVITTSGNIVVKVKVTDSRGRTAEETKVVNVHKYTTPVITVANVNRATNAGLPNDDGEYALCEYSYSISDVNGKNTHLFKIQYQSGDAWLDLVTYTDYVKSGEYISSAVFSADSAFAFRFVVTDYFGEYSIARTMEISYSLLNFGANGHSFAFGMHSSNRNTLESDLPLEQYQDASFSKGVNFLGNVFNISKAIQQILGKLFNPVGTIVINTTGVNPGTYLGGTWEAFAPGRTLVGVGTGNDGSTSMTFTASSEVGEYIHKLTVDEIPSHRHKAFYQNSNDGYQGNEYDRLGFVRAGGQTPGSKDYYTHSVGNDSSHNNIQPSIVVYFWKRIE